MLDRVQLTHASHAPVLLTLLEAVRPERVLELGAGVYSTGLFLASRHVKRLASVEPFPAWQIFRDPRLTYMDEPPETLEGFDLVFIDDGRSKSERQQTIRRVLTQPHPLTVIHDARIYLPFVRSLGARISMVECDTILVAAS